MSTSGIQGCGCGPDRTGLPTEPLNAHGDRCPVWDWALAMGKITPAWRLAQLGGYAQELGLTEEELARESRFMPSAMRAMGPWTPFRSPAAGKPSTRRDWVPPPVTCYRSDYGFMVHIKGACRCPGNRTR